MTVASGGPEATGDGAPAADAAIEAVWLQSRPLVRQRIDGMLAAAASIADGSPDAALLADARRNAHNLAGMLGVFGFAGASRIAGSIEVGIDAYTSGEGAPDLVALVRALDDDLREALHGIEPAQERSDR